MNLSFNEELMRILDGKPNPEYADGQELLLTVRIQLAKPIDIEKFMKSLFPSLNYSIGNTIMLIDNYKELKARTKMELVDNGPLN